MSLSRRQFVYVASLSVVATSTSPSLFAQDKAQAASETFTDQGTATLATLSLRDFEGLIGARFSISLPGQSLGKVTLIAAAESGPVKFSPMSRVAGQVVEPVPGRPLDCFSLRFQGAGGRLPQDTYLMEESSLGAFPLFIVPEGPGGSARPTYVATFIRFADSVPSMPIGPSK
jgi:hypothetical protein